MLCFTNATEVSTSSAAETRKSPTCISVAKKEEERTTRDATGEWYGENGFMLCTSHSSKAYLTDYAVWETACRRN